ncbi:M20 family metallopeptidase [Kribbella solani]|uniref:M20 metallopeptidase family protein n=1 Tax=Kribbella solani TaxID=236067 RepID=UPI0029BD6103|nr:M20 family metallopeptidase [Kribbella solani]MDX2967801.1 M20 family metallopeptidase [Kribbella solani]MDX3005314.1 M20 family metallopeptidase [Kribbella solani]
MSTRELAEQFRSEIVTLRRALHQVPEYDLDLPKSQQLILDALAGLPLEITLGKELSSVTAVLRGGGGPGPVVLLRGDMDALPVTERTDVRFASQHPGMMHACGHDLHVAGLVGAAKVLCALRDELPGDVVFMFQPGEETSGGAPIMIREGVLDAAGRRADAAYGLHVGSSSQPLGMWSSRPGSFMAAADQLHVRVVGEGTHGSTPFRGKDPIPVACEMVIALQTMITRQFDVFDPVVLTVGRIAGGTKENIIPDDAFFDATVRTFSEATRAKVARTSVQLVESMAAAHGLTVEVEYQIGYPVTVNNPDEYAFARDTIVDLFGADRFQERANPRCGAEDMSYVLNEVPGVYLNLSACASPDPETAPDNHSPLANFNDSVLPDASALLAELAVRRLRR